MKKAVDLPYGIPDQRPYQIENQHAPGRAARQECDNEQEVELPGGKGDHSIASENVITGERSNVP